MAAVAAAAIPWLERAGGQGLGAKGEGGWGEGTAAGYRAGGCPLRRIIRPSPAHEKPHTFSFNASQFQRPEVQEIGKSPQIA
jgi:hypothetical protein